MKHTACLTLAASSLLLALPVCAEDASPQSLFKESLAVSQDKQASQIIDEIFSRFEKSAAAASDAIEKENKEAIDPKEGKNSKGGNGSKGGNAPAKDKPAADPVIPADTQPWWNNKVTDLLRSGPSLQEGQEGFYRRAIKSSSQIKVFADLPLIRETGIQEARGAFDTEFYSQGLLRRDNSPVGSTLTTGGPSRLKEDELLFETGVRKKLITGAEVSVSQNFSSLTNNSLYFDPAEQGKAELALTIVQPLLKGGGVKYNRSVMEIARLDTKIAASEFIRQTQDHLLEVSRSYWGLYLSRALLVEKRRLVQETEQTLKEIESRKGIDTQASQILRARSAFSMRNADTIRAEMAVRNAEARIKALVNSPDFYQSSDTEIIPADLPVLSAPMPRLGEAERVALRNRAEVKQAMEQLRSTIIRKNMQRQDLLPELNLVVKGGLRGLEPGGRTASAFGSEFDTGTPSYSVGLVFSVPIENNIAKARYRQRQLEVRQQIQQAYTTLETVLLETKVAWRELVTSARDLRAKFAASEATAADLKSLTERKGLETGLGTDSGNSSPAASNAADYLERLLDAQERHSIAREDFLRSLIVYNVSFVNVERAKGTILTHESISARRVQDPAQPKLPILILQKGKAEDSKTVKPVEAKATL